MSAENQYPDEVALVKDVRECRECKWFWGGIPPYGPYPAFDCRETYPAAMKNPPEQTMNTRPIKWLDAISRGDQLVEPAVLRGCRKAPIMTVGINPNLTSFFASTKGARWAYPSFQNEATYAYYYRHATVFQESVTDEFVTEHIEPGSEIRAEHDGWLLKTRRGTDHRWLCLEVVYQEQGEKHDALIEMVWKPSERAVIVAEQSWDTDGELGFKKGDVIAGTMKTPEEAEVQIDANGTGYYQRLIPVVERMSKEIGEDTNLLVGEDISMHDMVGCASPGWSDKYDIPQDIIAGNCVEKKDYVLRQIVQSQPAVIMIVSTSSLVMFAQGLEKSGGELDFDYKDRDVYDIMRETCRRKRYLNLERGGIVLKSRVIVTPHFSYSDNFKPHSRFQLGAWDAFCEEFKPDADILEAKGRVLDKTWNDFVPIQIDGKDDPIQDEIGIAAWEIIMARYYNPYDLITEALMDEHENGVLKIGKGGHFQRTDGHCAYCVNDKWSFPEGCPYGKA